MCFTIDPKHPKKKIAKRDITCYKVLEENLISPYLDYQYTLNKLVKDKIVLELSSWRDSINEGLHSYSSKMNAKIWSSWGRITYLAIIPKGSEYYYDSIDKEYVSNQIIIKERL